MHVFRNKWFWISIITLFGLALALEVYLIFNVVLKGLYTTKWHPLLLVLGVGSIACGAIGAKKKKWESKELRDMGKFLFFVALIWTFMEYGLVKSLLTMTGMVLLTRIVKLFVPKK